MKSDVSQWGLFGGSPTFERILHVGQPNLGDQAYFMSRVQRILETRWFTNNGECVRELESRLAAYLGVKHCVAVCNATIGLEIAIRAMPMEGEVIVPSLTFVATAHALQWQQITPVFCDVDPATHLIDPTQIERLITPKTTGILGVHLWGRPCAVDALEKIAQKHRLHLMFDAAHAFGCSYQGRYVGGFGRAEVFSFHATKFFNSFEGGAITTNDDDLAAKIRLMTNFGFAGYDNVVHVGTNGKMNEVSAAMGLASLRSLDEFLAVNRRNHFAYRAVLDKVPGLRLLPFDQDEKNNFQYVVVEYTPQPGGLSRDEIVRLLWAENVMARKYFWPGCHRMEPYKTLYPQAYLNLANTESVAEKLLILPTGTGVSEEEVQKVCGLLRGLVIDGQQIKQHLDRANPEPSRP